MRVGSDTAYSERTIALLDLKYLRWNVDCSARAARCATALRSPHGCPKLASGWPNARWQSRQTFIRTITHKNEVYRAAGSSRIALVQKVHQERCTSLDRELTLPSIALTVATVIQFNCIARPLSLGEAAEVLWRRSTSSELALSFFWPRIRISRGSPGGGGGRLGSVILLPAATFAQYPLTGSGMAARRHTFARPTSEILKRSANSDTGASRHCFEGLHARHCIRPNPGFFKLVSVVSTVHIDVSNLFSDQWRLEPLYLGGRHGLDVFVPVTPIHAVLCR